MVVVNLDQVGFLKKNMNASNRVAKKMGRILKWERTATVLYVFNSELVDFEGTFGGIYTTTRSSDMFKWWRQPVSVVTPRRWRSRNQCCGSITHSL